MGESRETRPASPNAHFATQKKTQKANTAIAKRKKTQTKNNEIKEKMKQKERNRTERRHEKKREATAESEKKWRKIIIQQRFIFGVSVYYVCVDYYTESCMSTRIIQFVSLSVGQ